MIFFEDIILKIKKSLSNHRAVFLLSLGLIVLSSLFIPSSTKAAWPIIGALVGLAISVIQVIPIAVAIYSFIFIISKVFVSISGALLNWIVSPDFVSVSYTNPGGPNGNPVIAAGLDITKSSVNLFLIILLVYIAVSIALRLEGEGGAKKLFTRLIIIALLVNFAPLLVGLIVDASNIMTNSTLKALGQSISNVLTQTSSWSDGIFNQLYGMITFSSSIIARGMIMICLNFATGLALLLYAILFLVRYVAIWVLVILSPIAFVSWIHPVFKKMFWDWWWKNVLEWSFIGAFMAFFLYLGARAFEILPVLFRTQMQTAGLEPEVVGLLNQTFPYFVVLAFLFLGFTMGLQTGAMGGELIIGMSKKAGGWVGNRIWKGASTWGQEKMQIRERVGGITKRWEEIPIARWFLPESMRKYSEARPAIDEARKRLSIHAHPELGHKAAVGDIYGKDAVGALLELVETGDSNDWFQQHMLHYGINPNDSDAVERLHGIKEYREKMARLLWLAREGGYHNTIIRGSPRLAEFAVDAGYAGYKDIPEDLAKEDPNFAKLPEGEKRKLIRKRAIKRAGDESRPQHIKNYEEQDAADRDVIEAYMDRGRDIWQAMAGVKRGHLRPLERISDMLVEFTKKTKEELANLSEEELIKIWEGFENTNRKIGNSGLFDYLSSVRAKEQGWTGEKIIKIATGRQITLPEKKKGKEPGKALGIGEGERTEKLYEETQRMEEAEAKKRKKK